MFFKDRNNGRIDMVIHSIIKEERKKVDKITIFIRKKDDNEAVVWKNIYRHEDGSLTIDVYDYEKEIDRD